MNIPCPDCGRRFGGHETYSRHLNKREGRCRTEGEMRLAGIYADATGVYRHRRAG